MERIEPLPPLNQSEIEALCRPFFGKESFLEHVEPLTGGAVMLPIS